MTHAYVYILASKRKGTLYIGVTKNLGARLGEHKAKPDLQSFTARYNVTRLVWYERFDFVAEALHYEKRLKKYKRAWKINLIEANNPNWEELILAYDD